MGLFLVGLVLVVIGALLLFAPGSLTRSTAVAALVVGTVFLEMSRADRYASAVLVILAIGFGYFWNIKQNRPTDEEVAEVAEVENDEE